MASSPPLSSTALLAVLPSLLPRRPTRANPGLLHQTDALALLVHAVHAALDFRYVPQQRGEALAGRLAGQQEHGEEPARAAERERERDEDAMSETTTAVEGEGEGDGDGDEQAEPSANQLERGWNARGEDAYTFHYAHEQSAMRFTIRIGRMGGRVSLMGMADEGEPHQFTVLLSDCVDAGFFPWPPADSNEVPPVDEAFASAAKVQEFVMQYVEKIVTRLIPGMRIEGYVEPTSGQPPASGSRPQAPLSQPRQPALSSPSNPYNPSIGHRDLDPLPGGLPRPFGPYGGSTASGLMDPDGGGMLVGQDHPMFRSRRDDGRETGPGGMINPPGARWDPVGPGYPGTGAGTGGGFPCAGGNGLNGQGVGDPDFDELLPPGEMGPDLRMPGRGMGMGGRGGRGGMGGPFGGGGMGGFGGLGGGMGGGGGFGGGGGGGGGGFYM